MGLQKIILVVTRGLEPISYRGALLSTLLHATVYVITQFAECTGTYCIANKMVLQKSLCMLPNDLKWPKIVIEQWNTHVGLPAEVGIFLLSTLSPWQTCPYAYVEIEEKHFFCRRFLGFAYSS
jgi:hypothetical protein